MPQPASGFLLVAPCQVETLEEDSDPSGSEKRHADGVTMYEVGRAGAVDECRWESATVGDGKLQANGRGSTPPVNVVSRQPDQHRRY